MNIPDNKLFAHIKLLPYGGFLKGESLGQKALTCVCVFFLKILGTSCQFSFYVCYTLKYTSHSSCSDPRDEFIGEGFGRNGSKSVQETKKNGSSEACKLPRMRMFWEPEW